MRKATISNPRYPHYIRIVRKVVKDWLDDDDEQEVVNTDNTEGVEDTESEETPESSDTEETREIVIYAGPGRSYTDTTTTGDAKVDTNKRKASIPIRSDYWNRLVPMSGDILYVRKGAITEEWEVKDFEPDNDRSVVYGEMNRNFNM